jgi:hypothetical protein
VLLARERRRVFLAAAGVCALGVICLSLHDAVRAPAPHAMEDTAARGESGGVVLFPGRGLCFSVPDKDRTYLVVGDESPEARARAGEFAAARGRPVTLFFTRVPHDIIEPVAPPFAPGTDEVRDNTALRRHPAYGFRQIHVLAARNIRQTFWERAAPAGPLSVVYWDGKRIGIACATGAGSFLCVDVLNAKILAQIEGDFDVICATRLAPSKKLAAALEEREVKYLVVEKVQKEKKPVAFPVPVHTLGRLPLRVAFSGGRATVREIGGQPLPAAD